jgi:hypothetical protein
MTKLQIEIDEEVAKRVDTAEHRFVTSGVAGDVTVIELV